MNSIVYLLCGIPGSGKSTFAKEHPEYRWVSRDKIRFSILSDTDDYFAKEKQVFSAFVREINNCIDNGESVFIDATHINRASRKKIMRKLHPCKINAIWFATDLKTCLERNEKRKGRAYVPPNQIISMYDRAERPELYEGFSKIHIVTPGKPIETIVRK